ncbi:hypothetical protein SDRG_08363 [Saprolegnia diclina VS20]|uniref:Uncharacterized protein n=1 Tax=Saprolegnia diclina (strain VS20) TaxID=1156394 RepID=T0QK64_SAPDV|nr:hypothetical protein SDRG_08363 [Saprolegnia diclina VS20]EQC34155.1 hypothetical protein SDRG_08363 [Saprolegnia diclina VS20]|eukprot:XP_008612467.1 hypothetical protein SDRG_08363 [Saprolegnia diclina VS20]
MKVVALSTLAACVALQTTAAVDLCRETVQCKPPGDDTCFLVSGDCPPCLAISPSPSGLRLCVATTTLGMCPLGYVSCNGSATSMPPPTTQPGTTPPPTSAIPWTTTAPVLPSPTVTFPTSVLPPVTSRPAATSPIVTTSATTTKSPEGPATSAPLAPSTTAPLNLPTSTTALSPQDYNESSTPTTNSTSTRKDTASSNSGPSASWTAAFVVGGVALALLLIFVARKYRKSHEDDDDDNDACTPDAPLTFTGHSSFQPMQRLRTTGSEDEPVPMMPPMRPSAFSKPNNDFVARTSLRNSAADTPPRASVASSMDFEINAVPSPVYTDSSRGHSAVDLWDEMPILISQKQSRMQPTTNDDNSVTL